MLKRVHLKNFKLHEDTRIDAAQITVFIGPNNSGKSSIFQALLLLRQAASWNSASLCQYLENAPPPVQPYQYSPLLTIDVGRFEEIVGQRGNDVHFRLSGVVHATKPHGGTQKTSVSAQLRVRENQLVYHAGSVDIAGTETAWEFVHGLPPRNPSIQLEGARYALQILPTFQLTGLGAIQYDGQDRGVTLPPETLLESRDAAQWFCAVPSNLIRSVHPVHALRGFEERGYPITDYPPASLELLTVHDRAIALPNALASDLELKKRLSDRLEELLHISIDYVHVPGKRLKILARSSANKARETLFLNEGMGANQVPFIFVPILLTPPNETILLSEPEAHLHPEGQCRLTRMLLKVAKEENIQFFIETHSEHVLHEILNAVGRGEWAKDDVALHYFQNVEGTAKVKRLGINEHGQVDGGLPGFFEQSLKEVTEFLDALEKT